MESYTSTWVPGPLLDRLCIAGFGKKLSDNTLCHANRYVTCISFVAYEWNLTRRAPSSRRDLYLSNWVFLINPLRTGRQCVCSLAWTDCGYESRQMSRYNVTRDVPSSDCTIIDTYLLRVSSSCLHGFPVGVLLVCRNASWQRNRPSVKNPIWSDKHPAEMRNKDNESTRSSTS